MIPHPAPEQLSAFLDGELMPADASSVREHLNECHACALQLLSFTQLKSATSRASQRFTASPAALQRLTAQLRPQEEKKPARLYTFPTFAWTALAAVLLLGVLMFGWRQTHEANTLSAELLDQHLAVLSGNAGPEVISTDRHTVKPWFQGKLPFSFNLPETLPPDNVLKGGDLTFLNGQPAALLLFTIHRHQVSVFVTQRSTSPNLPAPHKALSGFAIHRENTQDLSLIGVSDVNPAELDILLTSVAQAQSPR